MNFEVFEPPGCHVGRTKAKFGPNRPVILYVLFLATDSLKKRTAGSLINDNYGAPENLHHELVLN